MKTFAAITVAVGGIIALGFVLTLLFALPVMYLWNWLMPEIFGLQTLTFWQAWGLTVLCWLLFKSSGSSSKKE